MKLDGASYFEFVHLSSHSSVNKISQISQSFTPISFIFGGSFSSDQKKRWKLEKKCTWIRVGVGHPELFPNDNDDKHMIRECGKISSVLQLNDVR